MTICKTCGVSVITPAYARPLVPITRNEEFWVEVIRDASRDTDPSPALHRVQKLRAIFREPELDRDADRVAITSQFQIGLSDAPGESEAT